jgi:uncharacterized protein
MEDTMNNGNLKLVQNIYAAFGRGDMQPLMDALDPNVTWAMIGPEDVPMAGIRHGKAGVMEFFKTLKEVQQLREFAPLKFLAADDTVVVIGHTKWTMNNNGVSGENDWVHVMTFMNGKIISYRGHQDTALLTQAYHAKPALKRAANS